MSVRRAAVAGMFYPDDPDRLDSEVRAHIDAADVPAVGLSLRILIVPHAGYVYSGPTAGYGYRLLRKTSWRRIVMLGPSHYVPFTGLALPGAAMMETPLGDVAVDTEGADLVLGDRLVHESVEAHRREHSLEVQLPFLRITAPGVPVVPLLTGAVDPVIAADAVEPLLDDGTLLLVSSDLSHYHSSATARRLDGATAGAIERLDADALDRESACGRTGIQIALHLARRRGYAVQTLDLRNSADTAGSPDRVVGYGAFAIGTG
ncbi:MAG: AmmeMemoRadiSam system protein B [Acidimicrobiia bacterium]|nr:AmmeMemoRadiSam system protein B [Acidimicrobiia bacterium]